MRGLIIININNLTLILNSYDCNKNCPYCIAKNNRKFTYDDNLEVLDNIMSFFSNNNIHVKRLVISGNGEPSLYSIKELKIIRNILDKYYYLFDNIRIHSSGNIFNNKNKFELFNISGMEFEVLRVSLDSDIDRYILGYTYDYLDSLLFKKGLVKCDIALTDYLKLDKSSLNSFMRKNPSLTKIRFKKLLKGVNNNKYSNWVLEHNLTDDKIMELITELGLKYSDGIYTSDDGKIIYKDSGDYENDLVINGGNILNYNEEIIDLKKLIKK